MHPRVSRRARLLYIEDNPSNVQLIHDALARATNWEIAHAATGADGLARLRAESFDVVLLDIHLPDLEGADVLATLRADPATREVPIMILSADASSAQIERMRALGATSYLTKPVDVVELVGRLEEIAGRVVDLGRESPPE